MLDDFLRRRAAPLLGSLAAWLAARRIGAASLTASVAVLHGLAVFDIAHRLYMPALAILVLARLLDALDGPLARLQGASGAALDRTLDALATGALAFAFGLAEPERALAAMFLMLGLIARAGGQGRTILGKTEIYGAFALACIFPDGFSLIAYLFGILCFAAAGLALAADFAKGRS